MLEVERRQQYLDKMIGEAEVLRPLVEECLDDDPAVRPTIATVCERIQVNKDVYMKECSQDVITLRQQLSLKDSEIQQLRATVDQVCIMKANCKILLYSYCVIFLVLHKVCNTTSSRSP